MKPEGVFLNQMFYEDWRRKRSWKSVKILRFPGMQSKETMNPDSHLAGKIFQVLKIFQNILISCLRAWKWNNVDFMQQKHFMTIKLTNNRLCLLFRQSKAFWYQVTLRKLYSTKIQAGKEFYYLHVMWDMI